MEDTLPTLVQDQVLFEVMPKLAGRKSLFITAQQLSGILQTMVDSGTYTLDG
jgi:hypothetical protein